MRPLHTESEALETDGVLRQLPPREDGHRSVEGSVESGLIGFNGVTSLLVEESLWQPSRALDALVGAEAVFSV